MEYVSIYHKGIEHKVSAFSVNRLENMGIVINDEYLDNLFINVSPYWKNVSDTNYLMLLNQDFHNRILYGKDTGLGAIFEYENGAVVNKYQTLFEAVSNGNLDNLYGFEHLHEKGQIPTYIKQPFFGSSLLASESHPYIDTLNDFVAEAKKILFSKTTKNSYEFWKKRLFKDYTFEEFQKQKLINMCFQFGEVMHGVRDYIKKQKNNPRFLLDDNEYKERLSVLRKRYDSLFEKVNNILDYKDVSGIYVFCLDKYKGYYVGQAKTSMYKRVIAHFIAPSSDFDKAYKATDVNDLYILKCPIKNINRIEQDCIATISKKFSLNSSVGGEALAWLSQDDYREENYLFSEKELKTVIKTITK